MIPPSTNLRKLEAALVANAAAGGHCPSRSVAFDPMDGALSGSGVDPQQQKDRTVTALLHRWRVRHTGTRCYSCSRTLIGRTPARSNCWLPLVEQVPDLPVLLICLLPAGVRGTLVSAVRVNFMALSRSDRRDATALAARVVKNQVLSPKLLDRIAMQDRRCAAFYRGAEQDRARWRIGVAGRRGRHTRAVPSTLQASLLARLDRLGPAREVAQIGAVIGRQFTHELIARWR